MLLLLLACSSDPEPVRTATFLAPEPPPPPAFEDAPPESPRLPVADALVQPIDAWLNTHASLRTTVQVDRPLYRPGETVWVRTWSLSSKDLSGVDGKVTYELVGPDGAAVAKKLVRQKAGFATNDLTIPGGFRGGSWKVRATVAGQPTAERTIQVMATELPSIKKELEFVRDAYGPGDEVTATLSLHDATDAALPNRDASAVVQLGDQKLPTMPIRTDDAGNALVTFRLPATLANDDGVLTVLVAEGGLTESVSRRVPIVTAKVQLSLFPEGGDLVSGLSSRVYFAATDASGRPADVAGRVVDETGHEVTTFESLHDGLGRFAILPEAGHTYVVEVQSPARVSVPVPAAQAAGCVLRTFDDLEDRERNLRLAVACTQPQDVSVVGTRRGVRVDATRVAVAAGTPSVVYLALPEASAGVVRVTVFDGLNVPVAERLVFRDRRARMTLTVTPEQGIRGPRETVSVGVQTNGADGKPVAASVSVAVVDDALISAANDKQGFLLSQLLLEPELAAQIEEPRWYLDLEEKDAGRGLDLLVGALGWRRFAWAPVFGRALDPDPEPVSYGGRKQAVAVPEFGGLSDAQRAAMGPGSRPGNEAATRSLLIQMLGTTGVGTVDSRLNVLGDEERGLADALQGLAGVEAANPLRRGGMGDAAVGVSVAGVSAGRVVAAVSFALTREEVEEGDPAEAMGRLKRSSSRAKSCAEAALNSTGTTLDRTLTVGFVVSAGRVSNVEVAGVDALSSCVKNMHRTLRFDEGLTGSFEAKWHLTGSILPGVAPTPSRPVVNAPKPRPTASYAAVRQFPVPHYSGPYAGERADFRPTIYWNAAVQTDAAGHATFSFPLSDAITSFRIHAEGVGGGQIGEGEAVFASTRPLTLGVKLPLEVTRGDRMLLPITVSHRGAAGANVALTSTLDDGLSWEKEAPTAIAMGGDTTRSMYYTLLASTREGAIPFSLAAGVGGLTDSVARMVRVVSQGYPQSWSRGGQLPQAAHQATLSEPLLDTVHATLRMFPSPLASVTAGLEGLVAQPGGCFEQTSSRNYPNVMVLQLLAAAGSGDPKLVSRTRGLVADGYRRLVAFETSSGGFDWFGRAPGHEALTAYGLLQFHDMAPVYGGVDPAMIERTTAWLKSRRDGEGGYLTPKAGPDALGRAPKSVADPYITWALVESGYGSDLGAEIAASARVAASSQDAYIVALAANTLLAAKHPGARDAVQRLVTLQLADGSWMGTTSITRSAGKYLAIETTSLAALALYGSKDPAQKAGAERAIVWIQAQRDGAGRFGGTQATVLALRALVQASKANPVSGTATVSVNGAVVDSVAYTSTSGKAESMDFGARLVAGLNEIVVRQDGDPVPYTLGVNYRSQTPASSHRRK